MTSEQGTYINIEKRIAALHASKSNLSNHLLDVRLNESARADVHSQLEKVNKDLAFLQYNPANIHSRSNSIYRLNSLTNYTIALKDKLLELNEDNKVIIFCKFTETIDRVTDNGFHGKSENNDEIIESFNYGNSRVIGVGKKANRGINFKKLNHCIAHSYTSSETDYNQGTKGRMTRLPINQLGYIHILVSYYIDSDNTVKYCQNYKWASSFLAQETNEMVAVSSIDECLNILKQDNK